MVRNNDGGKYSCLLTCFMSDFQKWQNVVLENWFPGLETNNDVISPVLAVKRVCPELICASNDFTRGPSGNAYSKGALSVLLHI